MIKLKKGLDIPIDAASPSDNIIEAKDSIRRVAVLGSDYVGMKPSLLVKVGDQVKKGTPLFKCKKTQGVVYTSPGSGTVAEINRGKRRVFQSIVVELDNSREEVSYENAVKDAEGLDREAVKKLLLETGLWTALRQRPFSKVPQADSEPAHIFVTAMDTNPLMYDPEVIITKHLDDFKTGVRILSKLTAGRVFICTRAGTALDMDDKTGSGSAAAVSVQQFEGPHPAGNPGTHIHFLSPNTLETTAWYIGFQDVIAVGKLFATGRLWTDRYIGVAGTGISDPGIYQVCLGASIDDILKKISVSRENSRIISGSLLNGFAADGPFAYAGRYFNQVTVISENIKQELFGWISPGFKKFSVMPVFLSRLSGRAKFKFHTGLNGSARAMVPVGAYEKVMPLDTLPTQLLRALLVKDTDMAMNLGVLDLDEEDLALCTFVDPGKVDYGPVLRAALTQIELEDM